MAIPKTSGLALSRDDHYRLLAVLPPSAAKIIAAAPARIYHAPFDGLEHDWTYTGLRGVVCFGYDAARGTHPTSYWFRRF